MMTEMQMICEMPVLRELDEVGEQDCTQGYFGFPKIEACPDETIDQNHHQEIAGIRTD